MKQNNQTYPQYKYLTLLIALAVTCMIVAIIVPYKIIKIGPFIAPGGVLVFPLFYFLGDVVVEVYGYRMAKQLTWITMLCIAFYSLVIATIIRTPSPPFWQLQAVYNQVLGSSIKVFFGFLVGMFISNFINIYAVSRWKILL